METMRAAVVRSFSEPLSIEQVPVPVPGPHEVLIKVEYTGVCHTDVHAVRGEWDELAPLPLIPGHEGHGPVVAIGADVEGVRIGDRLGGTWVASACGTCAYCLSGAEHLCPGQHNFGYSRAGSFAEFMILDPQYAASIPAGVDGVGVCPILCSGVSAYRALKATEARPGQWVVISGIGGVGHLAVQYARAMGLRVAAVDIDEAKLALARKHGAEVTVNALTQNPGAELTAQLGGAHAAVVTAASPQAFADSLAMLRRGGTVALVGRPQGAFSLDIVDTVRRGLTVRGSTAGSRLDLVEALELFADGAIDPSITLHPFASVGAVLADLASGLSDGSAVLDLTV
ncbi:zinc-dependent alcohol dehydrogenase [Pengzhenrongella sicca]|uniref:Alcohol dehydrogenase n=1 Tax=Pengzhenrongella sicca TaxID=2819238 RepID=A0A8A4ZFK0_9MICO|nr:zinc-dependent alcohol dehydrogenase [Pengzhenrongella sicca]QTE30674.1 zinc-dependent alcohol dehydrogenase [Pengzhenrongella sicca]